jgi:hypothetical protein
MDLHGEDPILAEGETPIASCPICKHDCVDFGKPYRSAILKE